MVADRLMTVTDVRHYGRGSKRRQVFLEGELWRSLSADVLKELPIRAGDTINVDDVNEQLSALEPRLARERALRLLSARERSRAEIAERLEDDGYTREVAFEVAERLAKTGLIDDTRYAAMLARSLVVVRGLGRTRALREMVRHGIADNMAIEALEETAPQSDEHQRAGDAATRLRRSHDTVARLAGRLVRRGFAPGVALTAAREAVPDGEDDEGANLL